MLESDKLQNKIYSLLNKRKYSEAFNLLEEENKEFQNNKKDFLLLAEIAGSYITLGNESYNLESVNQGMKLFKNNLETLKEVITEESIEYCLGIHKHVVG